MPQPEDVIRASAKGILSNLKQVNPDVLAMFKDAASELVEQNGGDPVSAICQTLAFISGHYKTAIVARSLLTGQEHQLTLIMTSTKDNGKLNVATCRSHLDNWWGQRISDSIRVIKGVKGAGGAIFDIYDDQYERFIDVFEHLY